ncbi:TIGR03621 family F420-dependent LLM class oxidoreductase [Amycolatopsis anabasis]|uniref:TIGR03621 family F420-dependent LLM class oxidoreductase n=1 Tax=Amycolatopsis anabasis TaxID=1840409 RepID=UPI00131D2C34|nr:TIGR03621 family F420-dependent LLM class oxidoreductase [Amycolatopsis anabasis]
MTSHPFRFGVNMLVPSSREEWVAKCRRAEELGYDVVTVADHLGMPAPFPALVLAAEATERVRLGTFVLNAPFYNPALLARDVAATDQLTGGRIELGLGAGYVRAEFEAAGMPFPPARERVDHLERTILELKRLYADPGYQPRPSQDPGPPLLLAGRGDRLLRLAAEHARIIAFSGAAPSRDGEFPALADADAVDERVEYVRGLLGDRAEETEFNILVLRLVAPGEREAFLEEARPYLGDIAGDRIDEMPTFLFGTPERMAERLRERRERFGFSYLNVTEDNMEKFAPVMEALR